MKELIKKDNDNIKNNINFLIEENQKKDKAIEEMKKEIKLLVDYDRQNKKEIEEIKNIIKILNEDNKKIKKEIEDNKERDKAFELMKNEIKILFEKEQKKNVEIEEMKNINTSLEKENKSNKKEIEEFKKIYTAMKNELKLIKENDKEKNKEIEEMRNTIKFLFEDNKANKKEIEENKQIVKTIDVMKNEIELLIVKEKKNNIEIEEMKKLVKCLTEENDNNKKEVEENKKYLLLMEKKYELLIKEYKDIIEKKISLFFDEDKKKKEKIEMNLRLHETYINKYKEYLDEKIIEFKKEKELKEKLKDDIFIKEYIFSNSLKPPDLQNHCVLINDNEGGGGLKAFEVFTGLLDNIPYIVYCNNRGRGTIIIKKIIDEIKVKELNGHECTPQVIRYYLKNEKEDFLLSTDWKNLLIVWEIQNNFEKKYVINNSNEKIADSILLFNILNKNYIVVSSREKKNFTKIYECGEKTAFVKNIFGTDENETNFIIPWEHKNNYYIIECCNSKKITINNFFVDEIYSVLLSKSGGNIYCGFIYNKDYLCVSCEGNFIRIWDLLNKIQFKKIYIKSYKGRGIIPWNNKYVVVGCYGYYYIIDIEEEKIVKEVEVLYGKRNSYLYGMKTIKTQIGECLLFSDDTCSDFWIVASVGIFDVNIWLSFKIGVMYCDS